MAGTSGRSRGGLSRRELLRLAGIGAAGTIVAACAPAAAPSPSTGTSASGTAPAAASAAAPTFSVDLAAAKREGKVVGYGVLIDSQWAALKNVMDKRAGVSLENYRAPTAQVVSRFETEKSAGKDLADFFIAESVYIAPIAKEGYLTKLPTAIIERVPAKWRDPDGYYAVFTLFPQTVIYNKKLVAPGDVPKTLDDLLLPKWKGKIAMVDPTLNETFLRWFYVIRQQMGETKARAFFSGLKAQGATNFSSGLTVSTNVNQGQFPIGIGFMTHVLSVGGPNGDMDYMRMDPMAAGNGAFALASKPPHPEATKACADLFFSKEYLQLSGDLGYPITVPGVKSAIPGADSITYELLPDLPKDKFDEMRKYLTSLLK
jgi:iron(III) transport system substrate-binding protein